jgi:hypothetical protein
MAAAFSVFRVFRGRFLPALAATQAPEPEMAVPEHGHSKPECSWVAGTKAGHDGR